MKPPPLPSGAPPLIAAQKIKDPFLRTALMRLAMFLVLAVSVWLVWRSVNNLTRANRELKQISSSVAVLADEVQLLERKMDAPEIARAEGRFKEAKEMLFAGPEEYAEWEKDLREQAAAFQLEALFQRGAIQALTNTEHKISLIPTTIDVEPAADGSSTDSPYRRLLGFARMLQKPNRRIDLTELVVSGDSNSVRRAKAAVQLWSQEVKPK